MVLDQALAPVDWAAIVAVVADTATSALTAGRTRARRPRPGV
ncbi:MULTISPECIES: hypothetical protein [unclassified Nocardiopsis]|nr:hypothetical protein [Nocardiopsis sp. TSRI0078]